MTASSPRTCIFGYATTADAAPVAALRCAATLGLAEQYGCPAVRVTEKGVLFDLKSGRILVARDRAAIVGCATLTLKKPWAIDPALFTKSKKPLYLLAMAVAPDRQRTGLGRRLIEEARAAAKEQHCDAIRLDAYDAPWGAGGFYEKCGFRETGRATYRETALIYFELIL